MDEPWIMTVKGPHGIKGSAVPMLPLDEQLTSLTLNHMSNHKSSNHNLQGKPHANGASRSPPKESTLNHNKNDSRDALRDGQNKLIPVRSNFLLNNHKFFIPGFPYILSSRIYFALCLICFKFYPSHFFPLSTIVIFSDISAIIRR